MIVDRNLFFGNYHVHFGSLSVAQVNAIEALLTAIEADTVTDLRWIAYMLATTKHETANTFRPIEEYGKGKGRSYGKPDEETGQTYYGRGFVQLTWRKNYQTMSDLLGVDLVAEPELALRPDLAYAIMRSGMERGLFTGRKLADYIHDTVTDYLNARKIINAMDRATTIAGYAENFEKILEAAVNKPADPNAKEDTNGRDTSSTS